MPSKCLINSILKLSPITIPTPASRGTSCFDEWSPRHSSGPLPGSPYRWVSFKGPNVAHKLVDQASRALQPLSVSSSGAPMTIRVTREGCQGSVWGGPLTPSGEKVYSVSVWQTHSEPQHFVVLGVHGFAFLSPTPGGVAGVRICIKCNPPQFKYNVSLSLGGETDCQQMSQLIKGSKEKKGVGRAFPGRTLAPINPRRHHTGHRWKGSRRGTELTKPFL